MLISRAPRLTTPLLTQVRGQAFGQIARLGPGPVFDALLEKALRLAEAAFGTLWTYDRDLVHRHVGDQVHILFIDDTGTSGQAGI